MRNWKLEMKNYKRNHLILIMEQQSRNEINDMEHILFLKDLMKKIIIDNWIQNIMEIFHELLEQSTTIKI